MFRRGTRVFEEQKVDGVSGGEQVGEKPAAPAAEKPADAKGTDTAWLNERLERAKRTAAEEALKAAGFSSLDEAKQAKALAEAQKSEAQKTAERLAALEPKAKEAEEIRGRLERYADAELAKLSDAQREAVLALSGGDKAKALDAVEKLRPTWGAPAAAATSTTTTTPPPPAATAPGRTAPPAAGATTSVDVKREFEALKTKNPFAAAQVLKDNWGTIVGESK